MNEDWESTEIELKRLQPSCPSRELRWAIQDRIEGRTARCLKHRVPRLTWRWIPLTGLALVCFALLIWIPRSTDPGGSDSNPVEGVTSPVAENEWWDRMQPVRRQNLFYDADYDGVVYLDGQKPVHQVRYRYLDVMVWTNDVERSGARLLVPREEFVVYPLNDH